MSADLSAELVRELVALGRKRSELTLKTDPNLPRTVFVQCGEDYEEHEAPPPLRKHALADLSSFIAAVKDQAIAPRPEVYVGPAGVTALLDRSDRREVVVVALNESKRLKLCQDLQNSPRQFEPRDAVKFLRLEMHGGNHGAVLQALGRIDFVRTGTSNTNTAHGKETLGKSVEALVQQAESVPESFTLGVPIWTTSGFTRYGTNIEVGVYLDLVAQKVELRVLSDEVERCRNLALAAVAKDLADALGDVPVFLGAP